MFKEQAEKRFARYKIAAIGFMCFFATVSAATLFIGLL